MIVLLAAVVLPIIAFGRRVRKLSRDSQDRVADASAMAGEILIAMPTVQAFTHEKIEADRFGLELTRVNGAAAEAFARLQSENLAVPYHSTLYKLWNDSHPPIGERIDFINGYRPWATGQPLKYGDHFEAPPATP